MTTLREIYVWGEIISIVPTKLESEHTYYSQAVIDEKDARIKELEQLNEGVPFSQQQMMSWKKPLMKKMHDEGMSSRAISRVLDVSHETVSSFVKALAGKGEK